MSSQSLANGGFRNKNISDLHVNTAFIVISRVKFRRKWAKGTLTISSSTVVEVLVLGNAVVEVLVLGIGVFEVLVLGNAVVVTLGLKQVSSSFSSRSLYKLT